MKLKNAVAPVEPNAPSQQPPEPQRNQAAVAFMVGGAVLAGCCIAGAAVRFGVAKPVEIAGYGVGALLGAIVLFWNLSSNAKTPKLRTRSDTDRPLPPVHTLIAVSLASSPAFGAEGDIVYSSGQDAVGRSSTPITPPEPTDILCDVEIDPIFYERFDEYKAHRPKDGCVILMTAVADSAEGDLTGAVMALSRRIAQMRATPLLLIDAGSGASEDPELAAECGLDLPHVPGLFDILSGQQRMSDCLLAEDELPGLTAIACGSVPNDWRSQLLSRQFDELITTARKLSDLIFLYTPVFTHEEELIERLSALSNCVMLVTPPRSGPAETKAIGRLAGVNATLFGRVSIDSPVSLNPIPLPSSTAQVPSHT
jgi:hypothetical protein